MLSETIPTHTYELTVLTKAFEEITGIKVNHQLLGEGEVVQAVQTQMQTNRNLYDAYVNDSDLIGTHSRLQQAYNLTELMAGPWADVTSPTLDLDDFIGIKLHHRPGRQPLPAARPAVRQPLLVPQGLVRQPRLPGRLQGEVRLRPRRAGQLVGLRGHRRVLHQRREGDRRRPGLRPHGLRQARPRPRLAHDRRLALDGRRRHRRASRTASRSTSGASAWRRAPATRVGSRPQPRRRGQRPGGGLRHRQVGRVAARVRAAGRGQLRLLPVAAGAQPGQRRPADLLVHRLPRRHGQAAVRGQQHRRRRGQPALARRALAARPLLAGGPEGRLPGRRLLDDPELDARRPRQGRLALRAVRHLEDRRHQEEPRRPDLRPRHARSATRASPSARRSSAASSSSTARPTGCAGRRPASTCPTIRSWRRSGGSRSAT